MIPLPPCRVRCFPARARQAAVYDFYKKQKRSRHERYRHLRRPRGQFEKYLSADTTGEACGTHGRVRFRKIHVADRSMYCSMNASGSIWRRWTCRESESLRWKASEAFLRPCASRSAGRIETHVPLWALSRTFIRNCACCTKSWRYAIVRIAELPFARRTALKPRKSAAEIFLSIWTAVYAANAWIS